MKPIRILFLCCALLSLRMLSFAQGVVLAPQTALKTVNGTTVPIAGAVITVCAANTGGFPCSPALANSVFKDAALTQPLSNPFNADSNGNYNFAIAPGNYTVTVTAAGYSGFSYQITASGTTGGGGGGGGLTGSLTPGCIPVTAPVGSATNLTCSSLIENNSIVRTPEPFQAPAVSGTAPNTGADLTGGDGSGFNRQATHSYIFADAGDGYSFHLVPGGNDYGQFIFGNPAAATQAGSNTYYVDGVTFPSTCGLMASLPANSAVTVYSMIREDFTCDPFNTGTNIILNLILSRQIAPYTTTVPWTLNQSNDILQGWGRGRVSNSITHGSTLALNSAYTSPYVSANPSGFTIALSTTCPNGVLPAGTYFFEVTWGPDVYRETPAAQETSLTTNGTTQCVQFTPPASPPSPVTIYNAYACHPTACASGTEQWQGQSAIGSGFSLGAFTSATGQPPNYNFTGAMVAESAKQPASRANFIFGVQVKHLSLDCIQTTGFGVGCMNLVDLSAEEESGAFYVDGSNSSGPSAFGWEEYSVGLGASNSAFDNIEISPSGTPSIAGIILDQVATFRGLTNFTTVVSVPTGVLVTGNQATPYSGTLVQSGHIERASTEGVKAMNLALEVHNLTCSPVNVPICYHITSTAKGSCGFSVRGGSSDVPIVDDITGYNPTQAFVGGYCNNWVFNPYLTSGAITTIDAVTAPTGLGGSGTAALTTNSNNLYGKINLSPLTGGGPAPSASGTLQLDFSGTYAQNNVFCTFSMWNGSGTWNARATAIGTANGTGHVNLTWDNNAVGLTTGSGYSITYSCGPV